MIAELTDEGRKGQFRVVRITCRNDDGVVLEHVVSHNLESGPLEPVINGAKADCLARANKIAAEDKKATAFLKTS